MPIRKDIHSVMVIGSGPIVIGQAAEFDFSGSQALASAREEGLRTILVNSNPATIQTDPGSADVVYIEPLTVETVEQIIAREKPDGILAGMGGQTALNICSELADRGVLEKYGVELLGTQLEAIQNSEDRDLFVKMMTEMGEPSPKSIAVNTLEEAYAAVDGVGGFPVVVRPAYTLGGTGGGVAYDREELTEIAGRGLIYSAINQVLIDESVLGWLEYEYEVMRDSVNNCITICSMENLDPMGIHTGESIVVAPAQTLPDAVHQKLRSAALRIIRGLKIWGGCNVQFAVNPKTGDYRVIEVNPRVSRSSALASKATGYPIARVATKIALGKTLDEIPNAVTGETTAAFEPTLDYVVMKIPRWPFDKFAISEKRLGTQMKSTGEVMAIGRTLEESLLKAIRSLEQGHIHLDPIESEDFEIIKELEHATHLRIFMICEAFRRDYTVAQVSRLTGWEEFFLSKLWNIVQYEKELEGDLTAIDHPTMLRAKQLGFADATIATFTGSTEFEVRARRKELAVIPTYKMVDTCGGEFRAITPYFYSTYERENESLPSDNKKVVILGSGPIRIGQGIEFDYSCVHGVRAARESGWEAIVVNNNPETVSTDFDISDKLYFEPLTLEDVLNIIENENPDGVIVQYGGQTAINLARPLQNYLDQSPHLKTRILGTSVEGIEAAEDREQFERVTRQQGIKIPDARICLGVEQVMDTAKDLGFPVLVRPSYVLGGRGMEIVMSEEDLSRYLRHHVADTMHEHPILIDKFLSDATELDVDAVSDGEQVLVAAVMEHIEEAGVHSGDSYCAIPPFSMKPSIVAEVREITKKLALALGVEGLINIQCAVKDGKVYVLEANPRASRTVPYVSKSIGIHLAQIGTKVMLGQSLAEQGFPEGLNIDPPYFSVKAPVFPFLKLPGVDAILSPEMKSTGEGMGIAPGFGMAYYNAIMGSEPKFTSKGTVYITVKDRDKARVVPIARRLHEMGFRVVGTRGTAEHLRSADIPTETVYRIEEHNHPDALDLMRKGEVNLIINTPTRTSGATRDGNMMRRLAVELEIPFLQTINSAIAELRAIEIALDRGDQPPQVRSIHEYLFQTRIKHLSGIRKLDQAALSEIGTEFGLDESRVRLNIEALNVDLDEEERIELESVA